MEDYKQEMREVFTRYYSTEGAEHRQMKRTTTDVLHELRGVIPAHPIDEHDVYEMLKSLGFEQDMQVLHEQVCIREEDKKKGIEAEYDNVEIGRRFVWLVYEKNA